MSSLIAIVHCDGSPVEARELGRAIEPSRRGPDAHRTWTDGPVGLAHGLLDINGDSAARQPATLDGETWIAADTRIDDRASLVRALEATRDRRLPDRSALSAAADHDLLLYAYRAWGQRCVERLIGDFAFAIWDGRERTLFCARDQLGVAPLYYAVVGGRVIVASELSSIRSFPEVDDRLDDLAVADYLLFGQSQEPDATIFAAVRRLPPAHTLTWSTGEVSSNRYWELRPPAESEVCPDPVAGLKEVLQSAVEDRLRDTDSAGILLSGGIDSPLIAAIAKAAGPLDLRAGTAVFDHLVHDDEGDFAAIAARALEIPIEFHPADRYRLFEGWDDPATPWPEPMLDPTAALGADVMRALAAGSRIALTGHDGDSICRTWLPTHFRRLIGRGRLLTTTREIEQLSRLTGSFPPRGMTGLRWPRMARQRRRRAARCFPAWIDRSFAAELELRDRWQRVRAPRRPWSRSPEADSLELLTGPGIRYTLEAHDPAWCGAAVEARHPLLDLRVIEYCLALPPIPWKIDKAILRRIAARSFPPSISDRPKAGGSEDALEARLDAGLGPARAETRSAQVRRYLDPALMPSLRSVADDEEAAWPRLWAIGLDLWLHKQSLAD